MISPRLSITWAFLLCLLLTAPWPAAAATRPLWWGQAQKEARAVGYRLLDAPALARLLKRPQGTLLVDVRPSYEYAAGHIPRARNLEFHLGHRHRLDPATATAFRRLAGSNPDRRIVIYCRSFR